MAWQTEMTEVLRVLLNDLAATPSYDDVVLQRVLVVAMGQVANEMTFSRDFVVDRTVRSVTPDPTDDASGTRDESFINLSTIKAAAIIDRGAARLAASQGILIRDGSSLVDLREQLKGTLVLLDKGWNAVYDDQKLQYMAGRVRTAGAAVMTPFRIFAGYDSPGASSPFEGRSPYSPMSF